MAGMTAHGTSGPRHSVHPRPRIGCGPTPRPFARSCRTLCAPRGPHAHHMVYMCHARGWRPHGVQHATPWAQMAHAYSSASRHTRRCSSRPPQGAGWSHSAEEAFMATQGPLVVVEGGGQQLVSVLVVFDLLARGQECATARGRTPRQRTGSERVVTPLRGASSFCVCTILAKRPVVPQRLRPKPSSLKRATKGGLIY